MYKKSAAILASVLFMSLLVGITKGQSMSLLHHPEQEIVISSPFEGRILFGGKPLAGARIERTVKWKDETGKTDFTTSDENGHFALPSVTESAKLPKLTQFVAHQEISVIHNDTKYTIWVMGKLGKEMYSELGGKPENFRCDLSDDLVRVESDDGLLGTVCKWDAIEKQGE